MPNHNFLGFSYIFFLHLYPSYQFFFTLLIPHFSFVCINCRGSGGKDDQEIVDNFQPNQLCTQVKIMKALEDDTAYKLRTLKENELDLIDTESVRQTLKDRQHGHEFFGEFEEGRKKMEGYIKALERELSKRRQVLDLLAQGGKYYESLEGEANIVATVNIKKKQS